MALTQDKWCPYKKRSGHRRAPRGDGARTREERAVHTPKREALGGTSPAESLTSDFQPPGQGDNKRGLWPSVLADRADKYHRPL